MCMQGLIEPPKAARGHATAHSTNIDIEIHDVTKYRLPFQRVTYDILALTAKLRRTNTELSLCMLDRELYLQVKKAERRAWGRG